MLFRSRAAADGWVAGSRTSLDWPAGAVPDAVSERVGIAKALLNVIVLADEALTHRDGDGAAGRITVTARGRPGALSADADRALKGGVTADDLTPRTVHAFLAGRFAEAYEIRLAGAAAGPDLLVFRLEW